MSSTALTLGTSGGARHAMPALALVDDEHVQTAAEEEQTIGSWNPVRAREVTGRGVDRA